MASNDMNPQTRIILTFVLGVMALGMLIAATQVGMPLRMVLLAVAISDIIFVIMMVAGKIIPDRKR